MPKFTSAEITTFELYNLNEIYLSVGRIINTLRGIGTKKTLRDEYYKSIIELPILPNKITNLQLEKLKKIYSELGGVIKYLGDIKIKCDKAYLKDNTFMYNGVTWDADEVICVTKDNGVKTLSGSKYFNKNIKWSICSQDGTIASDFGSMHWTKILFDFEIKMILCLPTGHISDREDAYLNNFVERKYFVDDNGVFNCRNYIVICRNVKNRGSGNKTFDVPVGMFGGKYTSSDNFADYAGGFAAELLREPETIKKMANIIKQRIIPQNLPGTNKIHRSK
ncbi:MAG: hypothetical protein LBF28_00810 [Rickettsiales bacterium]|jgi:hypothetical protein|nr:hypothetical protein [Rickettsiales bacterium]